MLNRFKGGAEFGHEVARPLDLRQHALLLPTVQLLLPAWRCKDGSGRRHMPRVARHKTSPKAVELILSPTPLAITTATKDDENHDLYVSQRRGRMLK